MNIQNQLQRAVLLNKLIEHHSVPLVMVRLNEREHSQTHVQIVVEAINLLRAGCGSVQFVFHNPENVTDVDIEKMQEIANSLALQENVSVRRVTDGCMTISPAGS